MIKGKIGKGVNEMTYQELVKVVAEQEGKKNLATIGDTREIVTLTLQQLALMNVIDLGKLLRPYVKTRQKKFRMGKGKS